MEKLFIDTWGWLCLVDARESGHKSAVFTVRDFVSRGARLYTSDAVLFETFTLLFRRLPRDRALSVMDSILGQKDLSIIHNDPALFMSIVHLRQQYSDQPDISFTDLMSFIVMHDQGITRVLSQDKHFEIVHFGFERIY